MRSLILTLSLAVALPMIPTIASADNHSCNQLRNTVVNAVPLQIRDLPYHALPCTVVSEVYLLTTIRSYSHGFLSERIEAVFRREGLVR